MGRSCAFETTLTPAERGAIQSLLRKTTLPQGVGTRLRILLLMADGLSQTKVRQELHVTKHTVTLWRKRWAGDKSRLEHEKLNMAENHLATKIFSIVSDAPRSGHPMTFTAEQITLIFALAVSSPQKFGYPFERWRMQDLADEAIKQGIVTTISRSRVHNFLKGSGYKTPLKPLLA